MYIYNVTTNIEEAAHMKWLQWMKQHHIPAVLSTGKFLSAKFTKVMVEEDMGGVTYAVQYTLADKALLTKYFEEDASGLTKEVQENFAGQLVSFTTELEVVDEYFVQRTAATHYIFTYGTLQENEVQLGVFSRPLVGFQDELQHYRLSDLKVANRYPTLEHTGSATDKITGKVYTLTPEELIKADTYEGEAYKRNEIILASGKKAWVYIAK